MQIVAPVEAYATMEGAKEEETVFMTKESQ